MNRASSGVTLVALLLDVPVSRVACWAITGGSFLFVDFGGASGLSHEPPRHPDRDARRGDAATLAFEAAETVPDPDLHCGLRATVGNISVLYDLASRSSHHIGGTRRPPFERLLFLTWEGTALPQSSQEIPGMRHAHTPAEEGPCESTIAGHSQRLNHTSRLVILEQRKAYHEAQANQRTGRRAAGSGERDWPRDGAAIRRARSKGGRRGAQ